MRLALLLLSLSLITGSAAAADMNPPADSGDRLAGARSHIAARQWAPALVELRRINERGNADWNNLMGYSLRKQTPPDLDAAEAHYLEALRLDPRHRGALEYLGELYLMRGNLAAAEARLASLDRLCPQGCEEQQDLKKAIAQHKGKNGK